MSQNKAVAALAASLAAAFAAAICLPEDPLVRMTLALPLAAAVGLSAWRTAR
jgi:Sec-independent protein secretion pathway component TatC